MHFHKAAILAQHDTKLRKEAEKSELGKNTHKDMNVTSMAEEIVQIILGNWLEV